MTDFLIVSLSSCRLNEGGFGLQSTKGGNGQERGVAQIDIRIEFSTNLYMMF